MIMHWSKSYIAAALLVSTITVCSENPTEQNRSEVQATPMQVPPSFPAEPEPVKPDPKPFPMQQLVVEQTHVQAPPIHIDTPAASTVSTPVQDVTKKVPTITTPSTKIAGNVKQNNAVTISVINESQSPKNSLINKLFSFNNIQAWLTKQFALKATGYAGAIGSLAVLIPNLNSAINAPAFKDGEEGKSRKQFLMKAAAATALGVASIALILYSNGNVSACNVAANASASCSNC